MASVAKIAQRLEELERRFTTVERERETAERERDQYRALYLETMERCRKLELGLIASKSEHLPPSDAQLSLGVLAMVLGDREPQELDAALAAVAEEQEVQGHTRRKPTGRRPLPQSGRPLL